MGSIYRPKLKDWRTRPPHAQRSAVYWAKYYVNGRAVRESLQTEHYEEAKRKLKQKEGAAASGAPLMLRADRILVKELLDTLRTEYQANGRRSLDRLDVCLGHLRPAFDARRALAVTAADVLAYVAARQGAGASNASINRELAALKRAYNLALAGDRLPRRPRITLLREATPRQGFFERPQFEAVRRHLPANLRGLVTVAYLTGWRLASELLPLTWAGVDFAAGTLRLEPGTTKSREGRTFIMTPELRAVLEAQRAETEHWQRARGRIIPWVFHRRGKPIRDFRRAWQLACAAAGVPGRIPHDFRRTAVRNLERAGVPRSAAMAMVGHKTEAIYRRYAIVDEAMLREAAEKLARASTGTFPGTFAAIRPGGVS